MQMGIIFVLLELIVYSFGDDAAQSTVHDNEFAEFETAEDAFTTILEDKNEATNTNSEASNINNKGSSGGSQEMEQRDEFDRTKEFSFLTDEEDFELSEKAPDPDSPPQEEVSQPDNKPNDIKPLTFADIPSHFRSNWSSYQVESIAILIIFVYVLNYIYGKSRNHSIAQKWFTDNLGEFERQFALVGDDGTSSAEEINGQLIRETEYSYWVWSTGRAGCKGMLTQLKLSKRQCLLSHGLNLIRPRMDKIIHTIEMDKGEMDSFVIIFGQRKSVLKVVKEMNDLAAYVTEKKNFEKISLPSNFCVFAEIAEIVPAILDATAIQFLKKCEKYIEYIHLTDQYSGPKQQDEQFSKLPETQPKLIFSYYLKDGTDIDQLLLNFTMYMFDKVRQYRLSREGKIRADKKRQNVQENFLKLTHQQRQEAAQTRREEKTRERKQRVMEEENPDRQKKLEKIEQKRDAKLKQAKIKQFKIK